MAQVSVRRFNTCAVNLFHSFKKCKMIAGETDSERKGSTERLKLEFGLISLAGFKGVKPVFQVSVQ